MASYKRLMEFLEKIPQPGNGRITPTIELNAVAGSVLLASLVLEYGDLKCIISNFEEMIAKNEREGMKEEVQHANLSFKELLIQHYRKVAEEEGRKFTAKILEDVEERADAAIASMENFTGQKFAPKESKDGKQEVAALKREDLSEGLSSSDQKEIIAEAVHQALHGNKEILKALIDRIPL